MNRKKLILFDWGNVMMNSEFGDYRIQDVNRDIAEELRIDDSLVNRIVKGDGMWTLYGKAHDDYLSSILPPGKVKEFKGAWKKYMARLPWFDDVLETMSLICQTGRTDIKTGILSVCSELDASLIKDRAGLFVDYYFFSFSMGLTKPDRRIYALIENVLDIEGSSILYFDDLSSSILAAYKNGWNSVCIDGTKPDFIRRKCSEFIEQELKPNAHYEISRLMKEVYTKDIGVRMPVYAHS